MRNRDAFSSCHPVVNFLYFALVLLVTMFCLHPAVLGLSLAGSVVYAVYLNGQRAVRFSLIFLLPMMLLTLVVNPAFNHQGITILTYLPTGNPLTLESILYGILNKLAAEGMELPHVAITGGFATEDQVYKALALGAPYISAVGLCRSSMAAAMSAKKIGDLIEAGKVPPELARFGTTKEELFSDLPELRGLYGSAADGFSTGAVGVYSYLNRIAYGLRHFAALNRKFDVKHIGRRDVFPLTRDAKELLDGTWLR